MLSSSSGCTGLNNPFDHRRNSNCSPAVTERCYIVQGSHFSQFAVVLCIIQHTYSSAETPCPMYEKGRLQTMLFQGSQCVKLMLNHKPKFSRRARPGFTKVITLVIYVNVYNKWTVQKPRMQTHTNILLGCFMNKAVDGIPPQSLFVCK